MTSGRAAALGQPVDGYALAYISIPFGGSTGGSAYGLRLDLRGRDGAEPGWPGPRPSGPPPVLEVRFGVGEEPGDLRLGGIAPAMVPDQLDLADGAALWIWTGLGIAGLVAIVVAADAICIGVNTTCSKDKDDDDDEDEDTSEPTQK